MEYSFVSIVIPVRNEEKHIKSCLERVFSQTYPRDKTEVLVIDGMSEDRTREMALRFPVRILDNPKGHRASGLNIGIKSARGEIIVRVDARTVIGADYVEKCVKTLLETGVDNVGGVQAPLITEKTGPMQRAIGFAATHPFGAGDAQFRLGRKSGLADSVYLGCFRKAVFEKAGLFDEDAPVIAEDSDINYRIKKAGGKVYLNKDIVAYYVPRDNLKDLWRLYFRYGGARAGFFLRHKVLRWRQLAPVAFVSALSFLSSALAANYIIYYIFNYIIYYIIYYIILFSLGVLLGLYVFADIFVSAFLALRQKNIRLFLPLAAVFPCMHFSWALGFIWRMLQRPKPGTYWTH